MSNADKQITCHDSGTIFTFSIKEQELFASVGRFNVLKRCKTCRAKENKQRLKMKLLLQMEPET
jgi:hypothetical protein